MLSRPHDLSTLSSCVAACLALLGLGCEGKGARLIKDSEGRSFEATCPKEKPCQFAQKSGPQRVEKPEQALLLGSRLVGICDVATGQPPQGPYDCRPLTCHADADCPPLHGMKDGQCLNHHCSDAAEAVGVQDAIMLCLAGTGLGRESAEQIERYALALNCGQPCTVPKPCQQP
jgi:hypothetical protein